MPLTSRVFTAVRNGHRIHVTDLDNAVAGDQHHRILHRYPAVAVNESAAAQRQSRRVFSRRRQRQRGQTQAKQYRYQLSVFHKYPPGYIFSQRGRYDERGTGCR